ncbi:ribonuclease H-like domain-containing protein [Tanacetum coccineum]
MRMEQYIQMIDYSLWEVIENGNAPPITKVVEGVETTIAPTTAEEKAQRRLELKARSTLLMGIPNEHQLKFNSIKDAKSLLQAVEKRFGGNAATKKTQRNLLKQQYENFTASSSEVLDQTFDRLQKLISQLEIHGESISQEDVNQKFLRSLSPEWNTHTIVWRNKPEIDTLSLDDLYNNLKIYEPKMAMLTMRARRFLKNTKRKLTVNCNETIGFDKSKVSVTTATKGDTLERSAGLQGTKKKHDRGRSRLEGCTVETTTSNALVLLCLESVEARLLVYKKNKSVYEEDIKAQLVGLEYQKTKVLDLVSKHVNAFDTIESLICFVTDDYSRFSWVFFLATKDETSGILKSFITRVENLIDQRVKVIRCDNGTEFKNKEMNQFCERKGTKACDDASKARTGFVIGKDFICYDLLTTNLHSLRSFKSSLGGWIPHSSGEMKRMLLKELEKKGGDPSKEDERDDQEKEYNMNPNMPVGKKLVIQMMDEVVGCRVSDEFYGGELHIVRSDCNVKQKEEGFLSVRKIRLSMRRWMTVWKRAATTATSLDAEQDRGNINKTQSKATLNEPSSLGASLGVNIPRSDKDSLKLKELVELCTNLQNRVIDLEKTKTSQAQEITSLKRTIKRLEKKGGSRTHGLKRLYKVGLSRRVESFDEEVHDLVGDEVVVESKVAIKAASIILVGVAIIVSATATTIPITPKEITLAQAHEELKTAKPKSKGKMFEPEPVKNVKERSIDAGEELAFKLQAEEEEEERIDKEKA